jgi:replicative DNA helicase
MGELRAPYPEIAEAGVIGCCVDSDHGYRLAAGRLVVGDFYHPTHAALFAACADMADLNGADLDTLEERIRRAASITGVDVDRVRRLVDDRPLQWDRNGTLARRVKEAANARAVMQACADAFNRIGSGERLEDVLADLAPLRLVIAGAS